MDTEINVVGMKRVNGYWTINDVGGDTYKWILDDKRCWCDTCEWILDDKINDVSDDTCEWTLDDV